MKYTALCLEAIIVLVLAWTCYALVTIANTRSASSRVPVAELRPTVAKPMVDEKQISATLRTIAQFSERRDYGPRDLVALAPRSVLSAAGVRIVSDGPTMPERELTVRMQSDTGQTAVIDGQLVRLGSSLPQGGKVLFMQPGSVVIQESNGRQTLRTPTERMSIGTLRAPDASDTTERQQTFDGRRRTGASYGTIR